MCDTFCYLDDGGVWFAKNSDRPPDEVQLARAFPRRAAGAGALSTQYLDLGADPGAAAIAVASQPTWLWGFEHGVNEHRVAIGNEAVYTTDDRRTAPVALLGMDIVRLTLERARDAAHAVLVLTELVETHGQGGSGWHHTDEPYFSSFLIADPHRASVIETSNRTWVAREVRRGGVAISNRLTLGSDWTSASADVAPGCDWQAWRDPKAPTGIADHRLAVTRACVSHGAEVGLASIVAALRDHGPSRPGLPRDVEPDWSGVSVCMHVRGYQATTASLVSRLPADPEAPARHWVALGSPCVSVYVPVIGDGLPAALADEARWQRFARLRERVEADPTGTVELASIRAELDPVEQQWWSETDVAATAAHPRPVARILDEGLRRVDETLNRLGV
jgi:hypothetical protein